MSQTAPSPLTHAPPVPSILWDTFEQTLRANMRRLAKDIASTLGQSEAPLLEALFKGPGATVKPYIFEEANSDTKEVDMRCDFLCQRPDAPKFLQRCSQPIVWNHQSHGISRCTEHLYTPQRTLPILPTLTPIERTALEEEDPDLFLAEDGTVYDKDFQVRGSYNPSTKELVLIDLTE